MISWMYHFVIIIKNLFWAKRSKNLIFLPNDPCPKISPTIMAHLKHRISNHLFLRQKITLKFRLGIFACLLAIVGAVMDHKFILIGTIWLSSFTAASYIIKLSWELIAVLIQYIKAFTEDEFSLKHWPVLAKYGKSRFNTPGPMLSLRS